MKMGKVRSARIQRKNYQVRFELLRRFVRFDLEPFET
jgi:hypothetical protein